MVPVSTSPHAPPQYSPMPAVWRGGFLLLFAALQLADVVTTNHALAVPEVHEGNPLMAIAMTHLGPMWWLPKAGIVAFAIFAVPRIRRRWPLKLVAAILVGFVANNLIYW